MPPPGASPARARCSSLDPAQNNAFRAINRAWQQGATVQRARRRAIRHHAGSPNERAGRSRQDARAAGRARRRPRRRARSGKPRIGLYQPWTGSMDEGWTRWVLEQYGFAFDRRSIPKTSRRRSARRSTCSSWPTMRGCRWRAQRRRARRSGAAPRADPEYAYQLTADDLQRVRAVRPRRRHARLPEQREHVRDPAAQAAGEERRRRLAAGRVLPARIDRRGRPPTRRTR